MLDAMSIPAFYTVCITLNNPSAPDFIAIESESVKYHQVFQSMIGTFQANVTCQVDIVL